jgi:hypothetical protein
MIGIKNKDTIRIAELLYDYWKRHNFLDPHMIKRWEFASKISFYVFHMADDLYLLTRYHKNNQLDLDKLFNVMDIKINDESAIRIITSIMGDSEDFHYGMEYSVLIEDMISLLETRGWGIYMRIEK